MERNVLVTVTGLLFTGSGEDEKDYIDVITPGQYFERDNRHYLVYEEVLEGCDTPIHNLITIAPEKISIRKNGVVATEMVFRPHHTTNTYYSTPFGNLDLSVTTHRIEVNVRVEGIAADIRYRLMINGEQKNDCFVKLLVQPQTKDGGFNL